MSTPHTNAAAGPALGARRGRPGRGPTIVDVARRAGVSKSAVSFALNGHGGVGAATRERILAAAAELDWQPSERARALTRNRALALGLVIARDPVLLSSDPFFPGFIAGVESELAPLGQALVLQVVGDDPRLEAEGYVRLARGQRVDGVFLSDLRFDDPRIELCRELGLPAVTLARPEQPSPFPAVCPDERTGIAAAVRHLAELGHERIAHVAGRQDLLHGAARLNRWRDTMGELGLEPALLEPADFTGAAGAAATRALLTRPDRPTAIVYANDVMAIAGLTIAHELGLSIPSELSIVGYDDTELAAHVHPALTTIGSDPMQYGRTACRALLHTIDGRGGDIELPRVRLIVRASTAAPATPRPARHRRNP